MENQANETDKNECQDQHALRWMRLSDRAFPPEKHFPGDAGFDLKSARMYYLRPKGVQVVSTDLAIRVPAGTYGRIAPRSGLARKQIDVGAGVIDANFTGAVDIVLYNHGEEPLLIRTGDRVAQLICEKIAHPNLVQVDCMNVDCMNETARGAAGFGSTGEN